jgi:hypothetical protein
MFAGRSGRSIRSIGGGKVVPSVPVAERVAVETVPTSEAPSFEFGGYRILVPDTQHVLSEAAGTTLFMQHLAFGLITAGLIYVHAAHYVGLTVSLAVLNVIDSDVETKVITTPSIFAVLSLTHLGCGGGMSRCARCSHRGGAVRTR